MTTTEGQFEPVCKVSDLPEGRARGARVNGLHIAVFNHNGEYHAVDNRCPHMGYPLVKGTIHDGILICHWHHWEFDLKTGACFAGRGDDVKTFPVRVIDGNVCVATWDHDDETREQRRRGLKALHQGLKQGSTFMTAKAVAALQAAGVKFAEIISQGLLYGVQKSNGGWTGGLAVLTIAGNMWKEVDEDDRNLFLVHGLSRIGGQRSSRPPQFPFPGNEDQDLVTLKRWFRRFIEQRNLTGAERVLLTLHDRGHGKEVLADFIFTAATDYYYTGKGHALDFGNKTLEALDYVEDVEAGHILRPIVVDLATRIRHEEDAQWAEAVPVLEDVFSRIDEIWSDNERSSTELDISAFTEVLLADDFRVSVREVEDRLRAGCSPQSLCRALTYASARRTVRFHLKNEGDWHAVANLYSYAHALYRAFEIAPGAELLRGIFHGAVVCTHLRWLNMPAARTPRSDETTGETFSGPAKSLERLQEYADFQRIYEAELTVNQYVTEGHDIAALRRRLTHILLQEDAELHMFQVLEAACRHYDLSDDPEERRVHLLAATRYITAQKVMKGILWATRNAEMLERGELLSERDDD